MTWRLLACTAAVCCAAAGQCVEPRKSLGEYPAQAGLESVSFGAEYLVRSVSGRGRTFFLNDHLVVEVAVFPARGREIALSLSHFRLEVGEKSRREVLAPAGPQFVAAGLKYPDWERRRNLEVIGAAGNAGVILGRPPAAGRFPGDPTGGNRLPAPPRAPDAGYGVEQDAPARADEVVIECALAERTAASPAAGYLYFPYKKKTKDLRAVELVYQGPAGKAVLRLR